VSLGMDATFAYILMDRIRPRLEEITILPPQAYLLTQITSEKPSVYLKYAVPGDDYKYEEMISNDTSLTGPEKIKIRMRRFAILNSSLVRRTIDKYQDGRLYQIRNPLLEQYQSPVDKYMKQISGMSRSDLKPEGTLTSDPLSQKDVQTKRSQDAETSVKGSPEASTRLTSGGISTKPSVTPVTASSSVVKDSLGTVTQDLPTTVPPPPSTARFEVLPGDVLLDRQSELPETIQVMLQSESREIRQLAYRFMTTPPNAEGVRKIHVLLGVTDRGAVAQPFFTVGLKNPFSFGSQYGELQRNGLCYQYGEPLRTFNTDGTEKRWWDERMRKEVPAPRRTALLDPSFFLDTARAAQFYVNALRNLPGISMKAIRQSSNINFPESIRGDYVPRPGFPLRKECEEGPVEYKNFPYTFPLPDLEPAMHYLLPTDRELSDYFKISKVLSYKDKGKQHDYYFSEGNRDVTWMTFEIRAEGWKTSTPAIKRALPPVQIGIPMIVEREERMVRRPMPIISPSKTIPLSGKDFKTLRGALANCYDALVGTVKTLLHGMALSRGSTKVTDFSNWSPQCKYVLQALRRLIRIYNRNKLKFCEKHAGFHKCDFGTKCKHTIDKLPVCAECVTLSVLATEEVHESILKEVKVAAVQCRVIWQKGIVVRKKDPPIDIAGNWADIATKLEDSVLTGNIETNHMTEILLKFLDGVDDAQDVPGYSEFTKGRERYILPSYGLCLLGYMSRSLPLCSLGNQIKEEYATYNRFRKEKDKHPWDDFNRKQVQTWSKSFFRKTPVNYELDEIGLPEGTPEIYVQPEEFNELIHDRPIRMAKAAPRGVFLVKEKGLGRSLPCTAVEDGALYKIQCFITPTDLHEQTVNPKVSAGGSWENARADGGFNRTLYSLYQSLKPIPANDPVLLGYPRVRMWKLKYDRSIPTESPAISLAFVYQRTADFIMAIGEDLLEPYIKHAAVCKREHCTEPDKHLPAMPFGIRELGGKVRVPCITTGFLNAICEPIRKKMFFTIKHDKRTSFRNHDINRPKVLDTFLAKMMESEIGHAGDLTVSTDNFPMWFMESIANGLYEGEVITEWEKHKLLLCTGPFRMIEPNEENRITKREHHIPDIKVWERAYMHNYPEPPDHRYGDVTPEEALAVLLKERNHVLFTKEAALCKNCRERTCDYHRPLFDDDDPVGPYQYRSARAERMLWGKDNKRQIYLPKPDLYSKEHDSDLMGGYAFKYEPHPTPELPPLLLTEQDELDRPKRSGRCPDHRTDKWIGDKEGITFHSDVTLSAYTKWVYNMGTGKWPGIETDVVVNEGACTICYTKPPEAGKLYLHKLEDCQKTQMELLIRNRRQNELNTEIIFGNPEEEDQPEELYLHGELFRYKEHKLISDTSTIFPKMFAAIRHGLTIMDGYLTKKGVLMSTSASIAMLYSYNLYADTCAENNWYGPGTYPGPRPEGVSELCGDDSFRFGNRPYIFIYREVITSLGGVWSKTKDVVGKLARGIFTEIPFEDGRTMLVPKLKTLVRPVKNVGGAAGWRRAIPAINSLQCPETLRRGLEDHIIKQFDELSKPDIPIQLPKQLGGIGRGRLTTANALLFNNIKRIVDPMEAYRALSIFRRSFEVRAHEDNSQLKLVEQLLDRYPPQVCISNDTTYRGLLSLGGVVPLKTEIAKVKGIVQSALCLDHPITPARFEVEDFDASIGVARMAQALQEHLHDVGLLDIKGLDQARDGLYALPLTDGDFFVKTYNVSATTAWSNFVCSPKARPTTLLAMQNDREAAPI